MERVFDLEAVLADVRQALESGRLDEAVRVLSTQRPADLVEVFEELHDDEQVELLPRMEVEDSADVLAAAPAGQPAAHRSRHRLRPLHEHAGGCHRFADLSADRQDDSEPLTR
jgi:hypothetical protein